jgi:hypothetical protein
MFELMCVATAVAWWTLGLAVGTWVVTGSTMLMLALGFGRASSRSSVPARSSRFITAGP